MEGIFLVTGGARSGKSSFAEKFAESFGSRIAYIATSQIFDEEMKHRVKLHRERRPDSWQTFESPFNAHETIRKIHDVDAILFDCVTIYLSNLICKFENLDDFEKISIAVKKSMEDLISASKNFCESGGKIIFVTNEVGSGIVPENKLARIYRDFAGISNQMLAQNSEKIFLVVSGIPIDLRQIQFKM